MSYSELRCFSEKVLSIIRNIVGSENVTISSKIEEDLRITGDDIWDLLNELDRKFDIDFEGFCFKEYFYEESEGWYLFPITFTFIIFRLFLKLIFCFFTCKLLEQLDSFLFKINFYKTRRKDLLVKDLITFAILSRFTLSSEVTFAFSKK